MSLNQLFNQFIGSANPAQADPSAGAQNSGSTLSKITSQIPGGLAGGAAAGGIVALLMGNKSARKIAGKAATYGGAAMLGGLAFKAYQNWQGNSAAQTESTASVPPGAQSEHAFHQQALADTSSKQSPFELTLIKAMIAAAKADGHIDAQEQGRIFDTVEQMNMSAQHKGIIFDFLQKDIPVAELVAGINSIEMKSELYLASCLVIDPDHPAERAHLDQLATALQIPADLSQQLEWQAQQAFSEAA